MTVNATVQERIEQLLARRADLQALRDEWQVIEDALAGGGAVKRAHTIERLAGFRSAGGTTVPFTEHVGVSRYLPKNAMEHPEEYAKRLEMTPFLPETPAILQSRQGALFRKPPEWRLPEALRGLERRATARGASLFDVVAKTAELCQTQGFPCVLVDREALPPDVAARKDAVSAEERDRRGLGRIVLAPFAAEQILDWAEDDRGLVWIKLLETCRSAANWDAAPERLQIVRIVDRTSIRAFEIRTRDGAPPALAERPPVPHGARDSNGNPIVPVHVFHATPARDGLGRPNLKGCAEADMAATRVLSEMMWILHMMVPILALKTHREPDKIGNMGIGASHLVVLQNKDGERAAEELAFVQLDPTAADRLFRTYEHLVAKAKDQGQKAVGVGVTGPLEQSGISKAWTFKTGEERVLFLLSTELERGFNWLLDLAARMEGADEEAAWIRFPESYEIEAPQERFALSERVLELARANGLPALAAEALARIAQLYTGPLDEKTAAALRADLQRIREGGAE